MEGCREPGGKPGFLLECFFLGPNELWYRKEPENVQPVEKLLATLTVYLNQST